MSQLALFNPPVENEDRTASLARPEPLSPGGDADPSSGPLDDSTDAQPSAGDPASLRDLLPGDSGYVFGWAFDQIGEAEALIDEYRAVHPDRRALLGHAFIALCPRWEVFGRRNPALIRAHMRELLDRIVQSGEKAGLAPGPPGRRAPWRSRPRQPSRRADQDREEHRKAEIYSEVRHQMRDEDRAKAWRERIG